jgi:predicted amidophosphoribosyltransferase
LLAREVANRLGAEYIPLLKSNAKKPQKSLEAEDRFKNADFYIAKDIDIGGRGVIIVDDIITSGASMSKAAALIRSLGCREIIGACLAIAYKDS